MTPGRTDLETGPAARPLRDRVALALDGQDPVLGRSVAFFLQALILLSIVSLTISTLPDLPLWLDRALAIEEWVVLTIFTVEYVLRIWSARRPVRYIFSVWGLIDLAAILPSLLSAGTDLRSIRAFRMLRLLRLLKLMRYARAMDRISAALREVREELVMFFVFALITLYLCAAGIYFFENDAQPEQFASIPHSLWWAVATLTTVGYGDVYPVTAGGKLFTAIVLFIGLGIVAVPTGLIATALTVTDNRSEQEEEPDAAPAPEEQDP